ncbi:MAG: AAA family ATPase [Candidatus Omnitrophota bacterium]|jgi:5-methylcytosine-specific restriction protein B|nr:MAG: AAA family ATPase [Candidatus Omnitrophota bacterium]
MDLKLEGVEGKKIDKDKFHWTHFYQSFADKLRSFKDKREELIAGIHEIADRVDGMQKLQDQFEDNTTGPLKDICPFTTIGIFNRGITDDNRKKIASELARLLAVDLPVPEIFDGIPLLDNRNSWFFGWDNKRNPNDIDLLWILFEEALHFSKSGDEYSRSSFIKAYDNATQIISAGWKLTIGLYWIRPWNFPTLDKLSRVYLSNKLKIKIGCNGPKKRCNANDYLDIMDALKASFHEESFPVHSFPELSLAAWESKGDDPLDSPEKDINYLPVPEPPSDKSYSVNNILAEGCFLESAKLEEILKRLREKKNLILQGPPGTGKTWLAKRIAFALIGKRDNSKVCALQFHPNLSYEDFVRGWRPTVNGKLELSDGPFLQMVTAAGNDPTAGYVLVIEEINRGNPAQIFGEMLTLLEVGKRTSDEALKLCYHKDDNERVFIPNNLFVIGTMNIADRSLALVDLALRRRFAFINLKPQFGELWQRWVCNQFSIDSNILSEIKKRIESLNNEISSDMSLGPQFQVGHSFVTPSSNIFISDSRNWFKQIVETEIGPLLDEYWFDAPEKARKATRQLLEGF